MPRCLPFLTGSGDWCSVCRRFSGDFGFIQSLFTTHDVFDYKAILWTSQSLSPTAAHLSSTQTIHYLLIFFTESFWETALLNRPPKKSKLRWPSTLMYVSMYVCMYHVSVAHLKWLANAYHPTGVHIVGISQKVISGNCE